MYGVIALSYTTTYHYTPLHTTTYHYTPLHTTTYHYTPLHTTTYHYIPLHTTTYHYIPLHTTTHHYIPLHTTTYHYTPLHTTTYHYIPLHTTTYHYIPLHTTTFKFSSYLSDRTYSISIESHTTDPRLISHGVPQGSVLAPILFNIYISPLLDIFDNYPDIYFHTYADDLQIYCNLPNPSTNIATLNKCLEDIRLWLSTNSLSLNTHKTQAILINTTKTVPIVPLIQINNHNIKYSPYVKNLGITID